jgi:DNA-binding MarR family transcriptional regulator
MEKLCKLKNVFKAIHKFEEMLKNEFNLSLNMVICLCSLNEKEYASGELALETEISPTRMSRVLSNLEAKGYVERFFGEHDKRVINFRITRSGKEKISYIKKQNIEIPEFITKK